MAAHEIRLGALDNRAPCAPPPEPICLARDGTWHWCFLTPTPGGSHTQPKYRIPALKLSGRVVSRTRPCKSQIRDVSTAPHAALAEYGLLSLQRALKGRWVTATLERVSVATRNCLSQGENVNPTLVQDTQGNADIPHDPAGTSVGSYPSCGTLWKEILII